MYWKAIKLLFLQNENNNENGYFGYLTVGCGMLDIDHYSNNWQS